MKPFSSLFTKIILCFFLNLVLVATVLAVFFLFETRIDINAVFGRRMLDRMRVAERLISHDLNRTSRGNWSDVLTRHSDIQQVQFALILKDGTQFVSRQMDISANAIGMVVDGFPHTLSPRYFPMPPDAPGRGGPVHEKMGEGPPFDGPEAGRIKPSVPESRHENSFLPMMRTTNPTRYWVRIMIPEPGTFNTSGPPSPCLLLAMSDSISGNGFFFDPFPWVAVGLVVLLISVLLWIPLVRSITRPIKRMTLATEEIAKGRFEVRIEENRTDEIGRLGNAINHMTIRLSNFIRGQKRFLGDIAHELGSPIARIQIGLGILEQRVGADNQQRVADVMEDVAHMTKLVNELLSFSKAEMNHHLPVKLISLNLLSLTREVVDREKIPSEVQISIEIESDIDVKASRELLSRALSNLLRNAIRYAGDSGPICLRAYRQRNQIFLEIKDSGPGVSEELLDQIFEPFFRPEPSRDRDSGGVGLGLAIVKTCIQACNGTIFAKNAIPSGLSVTMTLNAE